MKHTSIFKKILLLPFFMGLVSLSSCMDLSMSTNNFSSEEVNNFQIQKAGLSHTTETEYYEYICSENINHLLVSGPVDDGLIAITITDDSSHVIFNKKLSGYTTFDEDISGVSGIWTIKLDYQKVRGNFSMSLTNK